MAVTERARHELFKRIEETLGTEHAATMMELLPPVGWSEVATQRDVRSLAREVDAVRQDVEVLKGDVQVLKGDVQVLKGDVQVLKGDVQVLKGDVQALRVEMRGLEDRLTANMATKADIETLRSDLRRDVATWLFSAMGIQTATVGLLLAIVH